MARKSASKADKNTLYCSFCGKSQHEVMKLIAGPTVFICDECTDLCLDIVEGVEKSGASPEKGFLQRDVLRVAFGQPLSGDSKQLVPAIVAAVNSAYPGCKVSLRSLRSTVSGDVMYLNFDSPVALKFDETRKLNEEIQNLSLKLKIAEERLMAEKAGREKYERLYSELVETVFPIVIAELRSQGKLSLPDLETMLIVFADIVGFSTASEATRSNHLDLMRLIARNAIVSEGGVYVNTWGDGLVAAFRDPTQGLRCACKFVSHLGVDGIDVRVGVNWGVAKIVYNPATTRMDIDGETVNVGARIESLAAPGEVLVSDIVVQLEDLDKSQFQITKKELPLKKPIGTLAVGEMVTVHAVKHYPNS